MKFRMAQRISAGFTVVELLVASVVFALMMVFLVTVSESVRKSWERGEHSVEVSQNGRAILNLLERDLAQTTVSRTMQFAQDPNISAFLPAGEAQATHSTSLFFWMHSKDSESGLAQAGWYVAQAPGATNAAERFKLYRFHRPLTLANTQLSVGATDLTQNVFWMMSPQMTQPLFAANSTVVFSGALGFWAACLDRNGNPLPNLATADPQAAPLRFNSGARFQMSSRGTTVSGTLTAIYTDVSSQTLAANALPDSLRIVLLLTDERTLKRHATIAPIPANTLPADTEAIASYSEALAKDGIPNRVFSTTIKLMNSHDN